MRLIQPKPIVDSPLKVPGEQKIACEYPVTFVKYRFLHHAAPSGYSRLCDYLNAPRVELSNLIHMLGETLLRPYCLYQAKRGGKYEYSRYDYSLELQLLLDAVLRERSRDSLRNGLAQQSQHFRQLSLEMFSEVEALLNLRSSKVEKTAMNPENDAIETVT